MWKEPFICNLEHFFFSFTSRSLLAAIVSHARSISKWVTTSWKSLIFIKCEHCNEASKVLVRLYGEEIPLAKLWQIMEFQDGMFYRKTVCSGNPKMSQHQNDDTLKKVMNSRRFCSCKRSSICWKDVRINLTGRFCIMLSGWTTYDNRCHIAFPWASQRPLYIHVYTILNVNNTMLQECWPLSPRTIIIFILCDFGANTATLKVPIH